MEHVMVDLETMGVRPSSAFVSIGAVAFNPVNGYIQPSTFYATVDLGSCLEAGLTVDASTIYWWLEQNKDVQMKLLKDRQALADVLQDFTMWVSRVGGLYLWGNSNRFDLGILHNAYEAVKLPLPWAHWKERDCRTIEALDPSIRAGVAKPAGAHDPIADCIYQIEYICATLKRYNLKI